MFRVFCPSLVTLVLVITCCLAAVVCLKKIRIYCEGKTERNYQKNIKNYWKTKTRTHLTIPSQYILIFSRQTTPARQHVVTSNNITNE
jgi:hypothetical protein